MRSISRMFLTSLALFTFMLGTPAFADHIENAHGDWKFQFVTAEQEFASAEASIVIKRNQVSGTLNGMPIQGVLANNMIRFRAIRPDGKNYGLFEGRMKHGELQGTLTKGGQKSEWIMRRGS